MTTFMQFDAPGYRLGTKDEALQWVLAELRDLKAWRSKLDVDCASNEVKIGELRREFWKFLVRQGKVAGAIMALHRIDWLTSEQYLQILQEANATMIGVSRKLYE